MSIKDNHGEPKTGPRSAAGQGVVYSHGLSDERVSDLERSAKEVAQWRTSAAPAHAASANVEKTLRSPRGVRGEYDLSAGLDKVIAAIEALRAEQGALKPAKITQAAEPKDTEIWPERAHEDHFKLTSARVQPPWMKQATEQLRAELGLPCARCEGGLTLRQHEGEYGKRAESCRCSKWLYGARLLTNARMPGAAVGHGLGDVNWSLIEGYRLAPSAFDEVPRWDSIDLKNEARRILRGHTYDDSHRRGLLLTGTTGTAKSHIAQGILRKATLLYRVPARWVYWPDLLRRMQASFKNSKKGGETLDDIVNWLTEVRLLVIDEIGGEHVTGWARTQIESVLNRCENNKTTVIATTNFDEDKLREEIGDPSVSRLRELCEVVRVDGHDYRVMSLSERAGEGRG